MWRQVLESPTEQTQFLSLLDEYFSRPPPIPSAAKLPSSSSPRHLPPSHASSRSSPARPASLVTTPATRGPSAPSPAPQTESFSSRVQTAAAGAALRNTTATSSALRQAGLSQSASQSIAGFGAKHHETLAPHLANAARQGMKMQQQQEEGPKKPSGLQSSKSMAGVGDTSSGKNFTKALFSSKGALSKAEQDKDKYTGPLYVKPTTTPGTISHAPPPRRGAAPPPPPSSTASSGVKRVKALYDYEGTETEDLPVVEGEELTVIEQVGEDWLKCRNARGGEGLLPKNYTEAL
ncbi:uncharacterized protein JCM6883_003858 [Sporobolomyces salmoneus]|uniref:uncharacterized protein n=1 Tax=Sporobolomyces salmoneus TaxID=183962 RepID=UPI00317B9550